MKNKILILFIGMFLLIGVLGGVSAEKMWTFNNYTLNISNDLHVGGIYYGDGSGLTNLNISALDLSGYVPSKNVVLGNYNFSVGTSKLFVNYNTGNVGIGTTSPIGDTTKVLDIYGSGGSGIFFHNSVSGITSSDGGTLQQTGLNTYLYNRENGFMAFGTNNAERVRIDNAGNVGIGNDGTSGEPRFWCYICCFTNIEYPNKFK